MSKASETVCPAAPDIIQPPWEFQEGDEAPVLQKRGTDDNRLCTFRVKSEDHTLGNALRWILTANRRVELAAYSIPHPHSDAMCVRLQAEEGYDSCELLKGGCQTLSTLCTHLRQTYANAVDEFERKAKRVEDTGDVHMDDSTLLSEAMVRPKLRSVPMADSDSESSESEYDGDAVDTSDLMSRLIGLKAADKKKAKAKGSVEPITVEDSDSDSDVQMMEEQSTKKSKKKKRKEKSKKSKKKSKGESSSKKKKKRKKDSSSK